LVTYRGGIPARRRSPIPALTGLNVEQLRSCDEWRYHTAKPPTVALSLTLVLLAGRCRCLESSCLVLSCSCSVFVSYSLRLIFSFWLCFLVLAWHNTHTMMHTHTLVNRQVYARLKWFQKGAVSLPSTSPTLPASPSPPPLLFPPLP